MSRLGPLEESRRLSQRRPCVRNVLQELLQGLLMNA
jgi:hypothetical protein